MLNRKLWICIVTLALLVGLFPVGASAEGSTWASCAPTHNLGVTLPESLHNFPIAADATFKFATTTDEGNIAFCYDSNWSMDDLFNMYSLYMRNSEKFKADKGDGTGTLYFVYGIKHGYRIKIAVGLSIDNQVTVAIEPDRE